MDAFLAFLIFAALVVVDLAAMQVGFAPYYRFGLPVFYARKPAPAVESSAALVPALERAFRAGPRHPSIRFKPLSPRKAHLPLELALREMLFENRAGARYLPVMHARLDYDLDRRTLALTGYLNLSILAAVAYAVYRTLADPTFLPVALLIGVILLISYLSQSAVNRAILDEASRLRPDPKGFQNL